MRVTFTYKALLLSPDSTLLSPFNSMLNMLNIEGNCVEKTLDALEHLMDFNVDIIIIDSIIGKKDCNKFLSAIQDDYENKATPLIILSRDEKEKIFNYVNDYKNIISIFPIIKWDTLSKNLLRYLKLQKTNLYFLENSLMESEGRSTLDQLTGAYNRYGCEDVFQSLVSRKQAYNENFSVIFVDIDHFKKVNDTYGHDLGDEILKDFASTITSCIHQHDSLIRFGGEEFIIFLSNIDKKNARNHAESIRIKIQDTMYSSKNLKITASFGIAEFSKNERMDELFQRTDKLLYQAKSSGRNKVIYAQDS
jgi:diguanylate cyclase (GGDEF)-like protein